MSGEYSRWIRTPSQANGCLLSRIGFYAVVKENVAALYFVEGICVLCDYLRPLCECCFKFGLFLGWYLLE